MGSLFKKRAPAADSEDGWSPPEPEAFDRATVLQAAARDLDQGRVDNAEEGYKKILGVDNNDVEGLKGLAAVFVKKGFRSQAIATYNRLLAVDSTDDDSRQLLKDLMKSG
jgi:tetratricopeptide (TPR) repeat protein